MAEETEKPKSNVIRKKVDKNLPEEHVEGFGKFISERSQGLNQFDAATERLLKDTEKVTSIHNAALKKAYVAMEESKISVSDEGGTQDFSVVSFSEEAIQQLNSSTIEQDDEEIPDGQDADRREQITKVSVVSFGEDALKKLNPETDDDEPTPGPKSKSETNFLSEIIKTAIPLLVLGATFITSIKKMFEGGPLQGVANVFSKGAVVGMAKIAGKIFSKSFMKKIPIIGSLISLGSAFKRLKDGDIYGGLLDVGAAAAYMLPGLGTPLGIALDVLNASSDIGAAKQGISKSEWVGNAVVGAITFLWEKVQSIMDSGISWMVDKLYSSLPDSMVNKVLSALGLEKYSKGSLNNKVSSLEGELAEVPTDATGPEGHANKEKAVNIQRRIDKLKRKEGERQLKSLDSGDISRDEFLRNQIETMLNESDPAQRTKIRSRLQDDAGFDKTEVNDMYRELSESLKQNTEQIKQNKEQQSTVMANTNNVSNSTNVFQHTSKKIQDDRSQFRVAMSPMYA